MNTIVESYVEDVIMQRNKYIIIYIYMDEKTKKYLDNIFYDKGFLMKNIPIFLKKVRSEEFKEKGHQKKPYNTIEE